MKAVKLAVEMFLGLLLMTALGLAVIYLVASLGVNMSECNQALQWCH